MRMIRPLPTTNVTSTISQYDLLCNTLIIIGVIGILSGLLITILDYYKGGKTLWNEDELRVRMPRFSFAVIGQSDRQKFVQGSSSKFAGKIAQPLYEIEEQDEMEQPVDDVELAFSKNTENKKVENIEIVQKNQNKLNSKNRKKLNINLGE